MNRTVATYSGIAVAAVAAGAVILWYLRSSMKGTPYEGTGLLGFLGHTANTASAGTLQRAGETIGAVAFRVFNPESDIPDVHYRVVFPGGAAHAVYAGDIDKSGYFAWGGARYRLVLDGDTKRAVAA